MGALLPIAPRFFVKAIQPFCDFITLPNLSEHAHTLLLSAIFYHSVFLISSVISPNISKCYRSLDKRTKVNWDIHSVSMCQCFIICILSLDAFVNDTDLYKDKIGGYSANIGDVYAMACGYFLWDALISSYYISWFGPGFVFHGFASLQIFLFSFRPFLMWFGPAFLAFELSTPFLNIHWYLDKLHMSGSYLQLINGILLLASFFAVRIVWGWFMSYQVFSTLWMHRSDPRVSWLMSSIYFFSNMSLNFLNLYWYTKMLDALRRRLSQPQKMVTEKKVR